VYGSGVLAHLLALELFPDSYDGHRDYIEHMKVCMYLKSLKRQSGHYHGLADAQDDAPTDLKDGFRLSLRSCAGLSGLSSDQCSISYNATAKSLYLEVD
jgi:hypothetical protein